MHAGLDHFSETKHLEEYSVDDLVWTRIDYEIPYFDDIIVVSGHTPTQNILGNNRPGYIFKANHHIAIDCGAGKSNGRLAAICLAPDGALLILVWEVSPWIMMNCWISR